MLSMGELLHRRRKGIDGAMSDTDRITELEIQLAHQGKMIEEMSDVIHSQGQELTRVNRQLRLLLERAAEDEAASPAANVRPPHW